MSARTVPAPVRVIDNGVRSFVPPTFCFELWDEDGNHVATVSQLVMADEDDRELADFEALDALESGRGAGDQVRVLGRIDPYEVGGTGDAVGAGGGGEDRDPGARFTVTETVRTDTERQYPENS
ncbi:hypothetical protein OHB04_05390 [Streptomyces sp. NBC_01775]|uniref:hypothetical protein n=1 Tax=Streptomyces sp. NBC_01775 TaxID=2975939 RepID=UPI002DD9CC6D|nr:hypothetical protein [Streptomyces sp. NBC_01775]WSB75268.1 hypothetical protein OHB04_05390 [Streptomyces sp. NBC_01775]